MRRARNISAGRGEAGIVILIVAVVLLFVVGGMAALSIDVVTFYTARSEAQLAADGAALAGARVLANSGMTSDPSANTDGLETTAETLAQTIALQVARNNEVGGRNLATSEVSIAFNDADASFLTNPRVTVRTTRTDIPTFFARIWGSTTVTVQASATAEAYNPSGVNALGGTVVPVAPTCVKPWVLPNLSPVDGTTPIINSTTGAITDQRLLAKTPLPVQLQPVCAFNKCRNPPNPAITSLSPQAWFFYPSSSFPAPATGLPACASAFNAYQNSVAGCVQTPIACGSTVTLETSHAGLHPDTGQAVNCLIHTPNGSAGGTGDSVDLTSLPPAGPFQFLSGTDNPLVQAGNLAANTDVLVSDSIVTLPIFDQSSLPSTTATVIGFVQVFLSPDGSAIVQNGANSGLMNTMVLNIAGCGTGATGQPILGNGSSPVAVRLITP